MSLLQYVGGLVTDGFLDRIVGKASHLSGAALTSFTDRFLRDYAPDAGPAQRQAMARYVADSLNAGRAFNRLGTDDTLRVSAMADTRAVQEYAHSIQGNRPLRTKARVQYVQRVTISVTDTEAGTVENRSYRVTVYADVGATKEEIQRKAARASATYTQALYGKYETKSATLGTVETLAVYYGY